MKRGKRTSLLRRLLVAAGVLALLPAALAEPAAEDITKQCTVQVSSGSRRKLTDRSLREQWEYGENSATVGVILPDGVEAGALLVDWVFEPTAFEIEEYDAQKNVIRRRDQDCTFPNIDMVLELLPETRGVLLKLQGPDQGIAELTVYSRGTLPASVMRWQPPVEKADLMVVSAHQDDELIFFGGTIPYYSTAQGRPTVVVYMANCTRLRRQEALRGLYAMGVRNYPEFLNLRDKRAESMEEAIELWGGRENILRQLVQRIRRYRPEVIVTHDFGGEYGHMQHQLTAACMAYAIQAAADPSMFPEIQGPSGTWQVKKLYHHLYSQNVVRMDWKTPLAALNGYSPLQVAQIGYAQHESQQKYYQVRDGGKHDNSLFGLYFSAVGPDTLGNDMFEHIDDAALPLAQPVSTDSPAEAWNAALETDGETAGEPAEAPAATLTAEAPAATLTAEAPAATLTAEEPEATLTAEGTESPETSAVRAVPKTTEKRGWPAAAWVGLGAGSLAAAGAGAMAARSAMQKRRKALRRMGRRPPATRRPR